GWRAARVFHEGRSPVVGVQHRAGLRDGERSRSQRRLDGRSGANRCPGACCSWALDTRSETAPPATCCLPFLSNRLKRDSYFTASRSSGSEKCLLASRRSCDVEGGNANTFGAGVPGESVRSSVR